MQMMRIQECFLVMSLFVGFAIPTTAENTSPHSGPSILFCTPKGVALRPYLDLDWLGEIHELGFQPDYTESSTELDWERISQYNILVLYGVPEPDEGERNFSFHERARGSTSMSGSLSVTSTLGAGCS